MVSPHPLLLTKRLPSAYSRAQKKYVLKNDNVTDKEPLKKGILEKINNYLKCNVRLSLDLSSYIRRPVPNTFHNVEKPSKDELIAQAISRMANT